MQIFEPVSCLAPFVKSFVVVESSDTLVSRLLPDTSVVVAIRLKGAVQFEGIAENSVLPLFSLSGLRKSFRLVEYGKNSANILVQFKEGGAAAFFSLPIHELFETNVGLDEFFRPSELMMLEEQLWTAGSIEKKVSIVQQFFVERIRYQKADLLIINSVEKIKAASGVLDVKELSESMHISLDAFEKRFRKSVGTAPKQFADIVRMKALIGRAHLTDSLLDSALRAGFFDQSHFIRNFKKFTGLTPKDFFRHS
ncbi:helix-turn-helix transcriptional regulator [Dyadobacter sp. CY261]|uniref:response regulator transcription factor n=1 Tax=Dyadobacter sp. CY261 TaxID=2907203 RepID=UPI001F3E435B|nr:response regulator transcription factor [Dyadobacter sp. CY261]MCF0074212.1 helix-turn-helix transcriptional regulator [Dyadobacter sp. CY261]